MAEACKVLEYQSGTDFLSELGLNAQLLQDAVARGQAGRNGSTALDPLNAGGMFAHIYTIRGLRELLTGDGWKAINTDNFSLTVSPNGRIALVVASGDNQTGLRDGIPKTRNRRGNRTAEFLQANQLDMFETPSLLTEDSYADGEVQPQTWVLLYAAHAREVRAELSLPVSMDEKGRVDSWRIRVLLGSVPLDPKPTFGDDTSSPTDGGAEIDIPVERKS